MDTKRRERMLLIVVAVLGGVVALWFLYSSLGGAGTRRAQRNLLASDVDKLDDRFTRAVIDSKSLKDFRRRALPSNRTIAGSEYPNWLFALAEDAELRSLSVDAGAPMPVKGHYHRFTVTVKGVGSLEQMTEFLHGFHKADYLHRIRAITATPRDESRQIDLTFTIEALTLEDAANDTELPEDEIAELVEHGWREFAKPIVDRALFTAFRPPPPPQPPRNDDPPPAPPEPPAFDPSPFIFVTAIVVDVDNVPEAWVDYRTTGKKVRLRAGDEFTIGEKQPLVCKVHRIEPDQLVAEVAGGYYGIPLGKSFADAVMADP